MAESQAPQSTVYVNRIPADVTEDELQTAFSEFGTVESVRFAGNRFPHRRPGGNQTRYAFVKFSRPEEAEHAIQQDKHLQLHDQALDIEMATPMAARPRNRRRTPRPENGAGYPQQSQEGYYQQGDAGGGGAADSSLKSVQQQLSRLQRQEALLTKYYKEQHAFFTSQIAALKKHVNNMRHDDEGEGQDSHPPGQFQDSGAAEYN